MKTTKITLPDGVDKECIDLCNALNCIPDITTVESCCGHGTEPYRIWFDTENLETLPHLLYWFDGCHSGFYDWKIEVYTDCGRSFPTFMVQGPVGERAYNQSKAIAQLIMEDEEF